MQPIIIAFNGGLGSGKSTAIKFLKRYLGQFYNQTDGAPCSEDVNLVKFAQPLYDIQEYVYGRIQDVHTRPANFIKDRKLLQWLGTDWGRSTVGENVWVDLWKAEVKAITEDYAGFSTDRPVIVCDDVRFDNEAATVKAMGGIIVKISANFSKERAEGGVGISNHASEAGINFDYVDFVVENNSTLEAFNNQLSKIFAMRLPQESLYDKTPAA